MVLCAAILPSPLIGRITVEDTEGERLTLDPLLRIKSSAAALQCVKGQTGFQMKCLMSQEGHVKSLVVFIQLNCLFAVFL